jgi:putative transposase
MGKMTRKRYGAEFKAKVALEAIKGELTLAELSAKHGIHQTMIAAWKRQAIEGLASTFSGKAESVQATGEAELTRLHAKIGQLVVERDFWRRPPVDERGTEARDGRRIASVSLDRAAVRAAQISRSGRYYRPIGESEPTLALMRLIDETFLDCPYYGSRQMMRHLHRLGHRVRRNRVVRLMRKMGLRAIYPKPNTSAPHPEHRVDSCLLRDLAIMRPNQVWCSDATYIPMRRGFLYLVAIMDWHSRRVLSWRLSNTMDVRFCTEALEEALARHGRPEIFNTDQGSQPEFRSSSQQSCGPLLSARQTLRQVSSNPAFCVAWC